MLEKSQESTMDERDFEITIARLLRFVRTLKEAVSGSEFKTICGEFSIAVNGLEL